MASDVDWERPEARSRTRRSWDDALDAVRRRPGEWARLATYRGETSAYKAAQKVRRVPSLAEEASAWEVAARRLPGGGSAVYARYRPAVPGAAGETGFGGDAPQRAHDALRALIRSAAPAEAAAVLRAFVVGVGGRVVPLDELDGGGAAELVPVDLSMGAGDPVAAAAPVGTVARVVLEQLLPPLVEDAQRLLALRRAAARGGLPAGGELRMASGATGSDHGRRAGTTGP